LTKLEFLQQKNPSDIKCHENPSSDRRVVPCGETTLVFSATLRRRLKKHICVPKLNNSKTG